MANPMHILPSALFKRLVALAISILFVFSSWQTVYGAEKKPAKIRLFGSIEFRGPLKALPQWLKVLDKNAQNKILVDGFKLNGGTTWEQFKAKVDGKPLITQIKIVNSFWNQWPYKQDKHVYKALDYWAAPYEFRKNSGDCEDYAIVKYFTLRALGVPMEQMRIIVVKDTILNLAHAILAVYIDEDIFILDNISKNVLSHSRIRNYIPQYSVNEKNRWMHVMPKK